jgi:hypothetical protein
MALSVASEIGRERGAVGPASAVDEPHELHEFHASAVLHETDSEVLVKAAADVARPEPRRLERAVAEIPGSEPMTSSERRQRTWTPDLRAVAPAGSIGKG